MFALICSFQLAVVVDVLPGGAGSCSRREAQGFDPFPRRLPLRLKGMVTVIVPATTAVSPPFACLHRRTTSAFSMSASGAFVPLIVDE
jgi:hypothetical protein